MTVAYGDIRLKPKGHLNQELMCEDMDEYDMHNTDRSDEMTTIPHTAQDDKFDETTRIVPTFMSSRFLDIPNKDIADT